MNEPRRKFYQDDLSRLFLVEFLQNSRVDPELQSILDGHDITKDPEYADENVQRRIELHSHFLDHGFPEDRRVYAALCSPEIGYGAFADVYIPAWTVIGEYTGQITAKSRNTDYAWAYHSEPKDAQGNKLKIRTNGRTAGNMTRFLNHSDYPNCSVIHVPYKNRWRTLYMTNSSILPDQELTVFYGDIYWKDRVKKEE